MSLNCFVSQSPNVLLSLSLSLFPSLCLTLSLSLSFSLSLSSLLSFVLSPLFLARTRNERNESGSDRGADTSEKRSQGCQKRSLHYSTTSSGLGYTFSQKSKVRCVHQVLTFVTAAVLKETFLRMPYLSTLTTAPSFFFFFLFVTSARAEPIAKCVTQRRKRERERERERKRERERGRESEGEKERERKRKREREGNKEREE
jgi:hypothetical protein